MKKLLLAKKWNGEDPTGWYMSEKLDGVRAFWDAKKRKLFSRNGNEFDAPDWFTKQFPSHDCDGELWAGRGNFQIAVGIARSKASADWERLEYIVFDDCGAGTFEERYGRIQKIGSPPSSSGIFQTSGDVFQSLYISYLEHQYCSGHEHLQFDLALIESLGGEGVMLRKAKSKYVRGRSNSLLKVKTFGDAEAVVVDHIEGEGKHAGTLGAIVCELPDGVRFKIGSGFTDNQRSSGEPKIGSTITFKFQGSTNRGVPRFASFLRSRQLV